MSGSSLVTSSSQFSVFISPTCCVWRGWSFHHLAPGTVLSWFSSSLTSASESLVFNLLLQSVLSPGVISLDCITLHFICLLLIPMFFPLVLTFLWALTPFFSCECNISIWVANRPFKLNVSRVEPCFYFLFCFYTPVRHTYPGLVVLEGLCLHSIPGGLVKKTYFILLQHFSDCKSGKTVSLGKLIMGTAELCAWIRDERRKTEGIFQFLVDSQWQVNLVPMVFIETLALWCRLH